MSFKYAPFYCEENIWHLCGESRFDEVDAQVVFISNPRRTCAFWAQRAAHPGDAVLWDYHVVLVARGATGWDVWDLDTLLGLPVSLSRYVNETFPRSFWELDEYVDLMPRFRLIEGRSYRREFSSDRSHMRHPDGSWLQPPPPWPAVFKGASHPSFLSWVQMGGEDPEGVTLGVFLERFASNG